VNVSTDELLGRLDELFEGGEHGELIVASDGDGTLWRGDIAETLFIAALRERAIRSQALAALVAEATEHGVALSCQDDPNQVAGELLWANGAGDYPDLPAFAMMAWAFAGWRSEELAQFCRMVLDDFGFELARRPELGPVIAWTRRRGVPFWLVSASPLPIAQEAAARLELDPDRVVAMEPAQEAGMLLPRLASEPTYGAGKLRRLRARTAAPMLAALGDSCYDAALLAEARLAVAVSPSKELRARLAEIDGAVVLIT